MVSKRMKFMTAPDSTDTLAQEVIYFDVKEGIAYNVVAASRRRGLHKVSCGRCTSKFPQNCLRAYTPACVKPLVVCSAFREFILIIGWVCENSK
jgi:hypothetical protein